MVEMRQYRERYSKIADFLLKKRQEVLFVAISIILMIATAASIAIDQKELADSLAILAFLFLIVGIGLEIANVRR